MATCAISILALSLLMLEKLPFRSHILEIRLINCRFVTGFTDTQLDLRRSRPGWLPSDPTVPFLDFPSTLLETRHSIVHRQFPPLAELKKAAKQSLEWLWEWYWSRLDVALASSESRNRTAADVVDESEGTSLGSQELKERFQAVLKSYMKSRKAELKSGVKQAKKESRAAEVAASTVSEICTLRSSYQGMMLRLLVDEKTVIPADRAVGSSMAGAFLLWSPLLSKLSKLAREFEQSLIRRLLVGLNDHHQREPVREAMLEWLVHIHTADSWKQAREHLATPGRTVEDILERALTEPSPSNLRLAEALVQHKSTPNRDQWKLLLDAAKDEDMELDIDDAKSAKDEDMEVNIRYARPAIEKQQEQKEAAEPLKKLSGPQRVLGLWRPKHIGVLPTGWEDDE
jgi:ribosomal biogenesis protein LAS1